jgi:hypothetical protein
MHRAVLDWIETVTRGRDEEFSELLAQHFSIAGEAERRARYAMLAGHRNRRVFAANEAIRWYDARSRRSTTWALRTLDPAHSSRTLVPINRHDSAGYGPHTAPQRSDGQRPVSSMS